MLDSKQNNFVYMLSALLIFLVVLPILEEFDAVPDFLAQPISMICLLGIGVWSLRETVTTFRVGMGLVVFGVVLSLAGLQTKSEIAYFVALGPFAAFLILAIFSALKKVVYGQEMTPNRLIGVICVYLLIGILWATMYAVVYRSNPSAFSGLPIEQKSELGVTWVYYSFVTLTTLGYGDILPVNVVAKVLAFSEAVLGVFYMATLVAMLVSGYAAEAGRSRNQ